MTGPRRGPRSLGDRDSPSAARAYDSYLGGAHNFAPDRELAARARAVLPCVDAVARLSRSFLRRAVRLCVEQGIDQFLDLGSGIPTAGNVHEVARRHCPRARVVYVDYEPVAFAHARTMLADDPGVTMLHRDIRDVESVLTDPELHDLLDFSEPVGLLMVGVLMFIGDEDDPAELVRSYKSACAPGSLLAMSHLSDDEADRVTAAQVADLLSTYGAVGESLVVRDKATFESWFDGTVLVEPGVTLLADWRPDGSDGPNADSPAAALGYGGVGRVR